MIRAILLDVEGTTSSISFVHETLFPYAKKYLRTYLKTHWGDNELDTICRMILDDHGGSLICDLQNVEAAAISQMERDAKLTGLKLLQGKIWKMGFEVGELKAHVYEDIPLAFRQWKDNGLKLFIYSSGSIEAQKLFFSHTTFGDLLPFLSGHFDTATGGKQETTSYELIAKEIEMDADSILFISDIEQELNAARTAGMSTALAARAALPSNSAHHVISTLDKLLLTDISRR